MPATVGSAAELKEQLLASALEAYRQEYKELSESWRSLETKAQGGMAVAGVFIAGVLAFVREIAGAKATVAETWLLVLSTIALVATVCAALLVLAVRRAPLPPLGAKFHELVTDLLAVGDETELEARAPLLIGDQIRLWKQVNEPLARMLQSKAFRLIVSQWCLFVAIVLAAVLTLIEATK